MPCNGNTSPSRPCPSQYGNSVYTPIVRLEESPRLEALWEEVGQGPGLRKAIRAGGGEGSKVVIWVDCEGGWKGVMQVDSEGRWKVVIRGEAASMADVL